jgi:hypothetical protein
MGWSASVRSACVRLGSGMAVASLTVAVLSATAPPAAFFQGFETDNSGWDVFGAAYTAERVESGTNGVTSKTGGYHAEAVPGTRPATDWGGTTGSFFGGYTTSIDIYLDVDGAAANDTRFDFSSAVGTPANDHRRDFVFNAGFYNDTDATGTGNRFVISASNNAGRGGAYPKNPGREPFAITASGWYTFQHRFYDIGGRVLAVDLRILDASSQVLKTWTLSDPSDVIGTTVGGNQYGCSPCRNSRSWRSTTRAASRGPSARRPT